MTLREMLQATTYEQVAVYLAKLYRKEGADWNDMLYFAYEAAFNELLRLKGLETDLKKIVIKKGDPAYIYAWSDQPLYGDEQDNQEYDLAIINWETLIDLEVEQQSFVGNALAVAMILREITCFGFSNKAVQEAVERMALEDEEEWDDPEEDAVIASGVIDEPDEEAAEELDDDNTDDNKEEGIEHQN